MLHLLDSRGRPLRRGWEEEVTFESDACLALQLQGSVVGGGGAAASWAPCTPLLRVAAHIAAMLHLLDSRRSVLRRAHFAGGSDTLEGSVKAVWSGAAASWAPCYPLPWLPARIAAMLHLLDSRRRALRPLGRFRDVRGSAVHGRRVGVVGSRDVMGCAPPIVRSIGLREPQVYNSTIHAVSSLGRTGRARS